MDRVVSTIGQKNNCTFRGVFRRQTLDRGAATLGVDHIVTGHNAGDIAETVLINTILVPSPHGKPCIGGQSSEATSRGSVDGCTAICTQGEYTTRRSKPFQYAYENEIVMYVQLLRPFRLLSSAHATGHRYAYFKKFS